MANQRAREPAQATGHWLRKRKPVDYVRSVHGFTRDPSSNEDYVDDPFAMTDDVANEEANMGSLEGEENNEVIADDTVPNNVDVETKNAPAAMTGPGSGDAALGTSDDVGTTTAATSASGVTGLCVDAGKKDACASAATTAKDDAPESMPNDSNDSAGPEARDSNVDEGDANMEDGDAAVDSNVVVSDANVDEGDADADVDANVM
ncbi:hypothetical protein F441_10781 [Phytophthora nicotianae CJ01A1]|uniref:Uncharacterized protein n=1 Tax=Phytophthora nicotianae CJ01A1 TaxID=1317063 RepID=W2WUQ8_PHYNI|nr:hypothetical protein F441_10781 [Phytophthora nicotianae CJ01A1]